MREQFAPGGRVNALSMNGLPHLPKIRRRNRPPPLLQHFLDRIHATSHQLGKCCRGVESTYEIRVGRSRTVSGPYLDREGSDLRSGGGTLVLDSEDRWIGPGHPSIVVRDGREWLAHHYYDRELRGRSRLRMVPVRWDTEGWPVLDRTD